MKTYRTTEVDFLKGLEALSQSRAPPLIDIMDLAINELVIKWYPALVDKEIFALKHIVYTYLSLHWGCAPEDEIITHMLIRSKKFRTESEASQALEQLIKKKIVYSVKTRPTWKGSRVFDFCQSEFADEAMGTFDYIIQNSICAFFVPHKSNNSG